MKIYELPDRIQNNHLKAQCATREHNYTKSGNQRMKIRIQKRYRNYFFKKKMEILKLKNTRTEIFLKITRRDEQQT